MKLRGTVALVMALALCTFAVVGMFSSGRLSELAICVFPYFNPPTSK
jgi:hypothetical protein